jgi:hypothetical protein
MPVLALFTAQLSKEQYDLLRKEVGWATQKPPGGILHVAAFDDQGGIHVADVWESAEDLQNFVQSRLMPAFQKHNIPPPAASVFPVHQADAYPEVSTFVIKGAAGKSKPKGKPKPKGRKSKRR